MLERKKYVIRFHLVPLAYTVILQCQDALSFDFLGNLSCMVVLLAVYLCRFGNKVQSERFHLAYPLLHGHRDTGSCFH